MRRTPLLLAAVVSAALVLSACAEGTPATSPTSLTPGPSLSPEPTPTETSPTQTANLPTDCAQIGTAATRAATVDQLTLQGDGVGFVRPAPAGAALALGCDWFAGDASVVLILISTTDAASADAYIASLPAMGYTCGAGADGGSMCTMTTPNPDYPVDTVETIVSRGDVWIYLSTSNVDGAPLLADLETSIWES